MKTMTTTNKKGRRRRILFMVLAFLLMGSGVSAQESSRSIRGKITNIDGDPISEVYLQVKGKNQHTHSSMAGIFSLSNLSSSDTIVVSGLGYNTQYLAISQMNPSEQVQFVLQPIEIDLATVTVSPGADVSKAISKVDLAVSPVQSSQEIMTIVPGLFIGQHAGGGKAEQIFLRGFDIDHGTDINLQLDGMPVNMVSHAHGQGYSDLHFIIPELVEEIEYSKGPYDVAIGNFATAGAIQFKTKDHLHGSSISQEVGQFNTFRTVAQLNLVDQGQHSAYIASAYRSGDGPFESPQDFKRLNIFGKYQYKTSNGSSVTLSNSYFTSSWSASGQIPVRAIESGEITRWGAIDDTEGGETSRFNTNLQYQGMLSDRTSLKAQAWFSHYDFELFSNFTFFLEDPENGDQIRQRESRDLYGSQISLQHVSEYGNIDHFIEAGLGFRSDFSNDNELSKTINRSTIQFYHQFGDIRERNYYSYFNNEFSLGKWSINAGLRLDQIKARYADQKTPSTGTSEIYDAFISPKVSISYTLNHQLQVFAKYGLGFHSNDTRLAIFDAANPLMTRATGVDLGLVYKPSNKLMLNATLWHLDLEQELVYVGDAGIVEPSGKTNRYGLELGARISPVKYWNLRVDGNFTRARSIGEAEGEDLIPLAPKLTSLAQLSFKYPSGFFGGVKYRYMGDRPANEDNSIIAKGYFVTDLNLGYSLKKVDFSVIVENLFDVEWNETQFATESRLANETNSVEEIHFTPGTPFFIRGKVTYNF